MMAGDETRKGPWTEQEDLQLACFVGLFGERRWDFIAKVSGLNRTGKSCRLRWVNYLHPGLKRGKLTPEEEKLVLDLRSRWGNSWSRIARRLPGRTDNEIKNYWRTHMRKKAQEKKRNLSASSSSSSLCDASPPTTPLKDADASPPTTPLKDAMAEIGNVKRGDSTSAAFDSHEESVGGAPPSCCMDQLWQEIESFDVATGVHSIETGLLEGGQNMSVSRPCDTIMEPQVIWDVGYDSMWRMDDDEDKLWHSMADLCVTHNQTTS